MVEIVGLYSQIGNAAEHIQAVFQYKILSVSITLKLG